MKRSLHIASQSIFDVIELMMQQAGVDKNQVIVAFDTFRQLIKRKQLRSKR
ncbi:MAG: hypothetical protein ACXWV5_10865 [Flavitalea sp.]